MKQIGADRFAAGDAIDISGLGNGSAKISSSGRGCNGSGGMDLSWDLEAEKA
jgi:hypothetical protein